MEPQRREALAGELQLGQDPLPEVCLDPFRPDRGAVQGPKQQPRLRLGPPLRADLGPVVVVDLGIADVPVQELLDLDDVDAPLVTVFAWRADRELVAPIAIEIAARERRPESVERLCL